MNLFEQLAIKLAGLKKFRSQQGIPGIFALFLQTTCSYYQRI